MAVAVAGNMDWLESNGKWVAGYVVLGAVLIGMVEAGAGEIAAPLSVIIAFSVVMLNGNQIFAEINELVGA